MNDKDLMEIWKSNDQKLEEILLLNKAIVYDLTKERASRIVGRMRSPKKLFLLIAIPYTVILYLLSFLGMVAGGLFVTIGFGSIGLIMSATIIGYIYDLQLIGSIKRVDDVLGVQRKIAELKISSFNMIRLSIVQIPFWSICWISLDAIERSPLIYGGINITVFLGLIYLSYLLYKTLDPTKPKSRLVKFFLSGSEWEPLERATEILKQLEDSK